MILFGFRKREEARSDNTHEMVKEVIVHFSQKCMLFAFVLSHIEQANEFPRSLNVCFLI